MNGSWEDIDALYQAALQAVRKVRAKESPEGAFTSAILNKTNGLTLFRDGWPMLRFPQFTTAGDEIIAKKAADLLFVAGFGENGSDAKLKAAVTFEHVRLVRHANGRVFCTIEDNGAFPR